MGSCSSSIMLTKPRYVLLREISNGASWEQQRKHISIYQSWITSQIPPMAQSSSRLEIVGQGVNSPKVARIILLRSFL